MILPLLLATLSPNYSVVSEPTPSVQICVEMESHMRHAVDHGIIHKDQANLILARCLINYSTGPGTHYIEGTTLL